MFKLLFISGPLFAALLRLQQFPSQVEKTVKSDAFVVYPVTPLAVSSNSWRNNTRLLILETKLEENLLASVQEYLDGGGKVWDLSDNEGLSHAENYVSSTIETVMNVGEMSSVLEDRFNIDTNKDGAEAGQEEEDNPYTAGYLFGATERLGVSENLVKQKNLTLDFRPRGRQGSPSESHLPILQSAPEDGLQFDQELYLSQLRTEVLGRVVLYVPVVSSSMRVLEGRWECEGLAVVPARQTAGVGRAGNKWLSPPGCSMFSLQLSLPASSHLGRRPSLLQHLVTLATVQAVRTVEGLEDLEVGIKWPNDIYYGRQVKLGGVIAKSSFMGSQLSVTIGAGINLDNNLPTKSLNKIITDLGRRQLKQETLLAETFNQLEFLISECNQGRLAAVLELYYKYWLHDNQRVRITREDKTEERNVTVIGIDEFGFLQVKDSDESVFSVTCDGNSFDMMEGLIKPKY